MAEDTQVIEWSFSRQIAQTDWNQNLESHRLLICEFKQFLEPFHLPLFADRFMGMLRFQLQECGLLENSMISADLKDLYKFMIYKACMVETVRAESLK
jgi:hypothetical protein